MEPLAVLPPGALTLFAGAIVLGLVHGAEPGHGWPIAASYALDQDHKWAHGLAASILLGLGHLISSLAVVGLFFLAKSALDLHRINEPIVVLDLPIGGPVGIVAGVLLIGLGLREYRRRDSTHSHGHSHEHSHDHDTVTHHSHDHEDSMSNGWRDRLPFVGQGAHQHLSSAELDRKGLTGIVWTAFVLGFVHEEEFEIIGLCLGSSVCLELMLVYAVAVMVALVGLTVLLIAGYYRYEDRMERYAAHFPTVSAVVLVAMGLGFVLGLV